MVNSKTMTVEYHHLFANEILTRGYPLANRESVQHLIISEHQLSANVLGSKSYAVLVNLEDGKISTFSCSCPYSGPCKHMAAIFLLLDEEALKKRLEKKKS